MNKDINNINQNNILTYILSGILFTVLIIFIILNTVHLHEKNQSLKVVEEFILASK